MFVPMSFADALAPVALGAQRRRRPLTLALFGSLARFSPLCMPPSGERLPVFSIDVREWPGAAHQIRKIDYNTAQPQSALEHLTPAAFTQQQAAAPFPL